MRSDRVKLHRIAACVSVVACLVAAIAHADSRQPGSTAVDHILNGVVFDASGRKTATVEILLRALMDAGDQTIQQDNLHCSLGAVYLKRMNPMATNPVPVREPLIAELAEMASGGTNSISGSCETDHCTLHLSHRNSEDVSATDYAFAMVDGKVDVGSLTCVSTP